MGWMMKEILAGMETLYRLRLKGAPAADQIQQCAEGWYQVVVKSIPNPIQEIDRKRLKESFLILCCTCREWPAPADLLYFMPARPQVEALTFELPPDPIPPEEARRRWKELGEKLGNGPLAETIRKEVSKNR